MSFEDRYPAVDAEVLIEWLRELPKGTMVSFSGLTYCRDKWRGKALVNIEFREILYRNSAGELVLEEPPR